MPFLRLPSPRNRLQPYPLLIPDPIQHLLIPPDDINLVLHPPLHFAPLNPLLRRRHAFPPAFFYGQVGHRQVQSGLEYLSNDRNDAD